MARRAAAKGRLPPSDDEEQECRVWLRGGYCALGDACVHAHDPLKRGLRQCKKQQGPARPDEGLGTGTSQKASGDGKAAGKERKLTSAPDSEKPPRIKREHPGHWRKQRRELEAKEQKLVARLAAEQRRRGEPRRGQGDEELKGGKRRKKKTSLQGAPKEAEQA
mmetsp:Transcript_50603/g.117500  ORF Transcript_50603/g.117500 Transcript_50603/m.117500 type:complete len:164 (+) Transcript_50603:78-569(+)|eukprot:CAMPEP_0171069022 /NCGR_PEP_ID=MMETSP0766_2-20121228/8904_1 /TAXON_ID=439317 /ORGANISM="Gambierdiscus australes, Strain CAWD 149" /LENGTH=163 /DNA_ID=CAMNT_0011525375 /DNA_START=70 /DNA_END=561 /DNA_ORIENTATION=-